MLLSFANSTESVSYTHLDVNRVESVDAPEVVVATSEQYDPLVQEEEDLEDYEPRIDHEQVGGSDSEVSVSHPAEEAQDEEEEYDPEAAFNEFEQELKHEQNQETEVRKIENHEPQSVVENPETERSHEGENFETQTNFANHETEPVNEKVNHDETHVIERHNTDHLTESSTPENQTEANKPNHDQELDGTHNFENVIEKDDDLQMRNPVDDVEDELYVRKTNVEDNADEENDEDEDDYDPESALDRNIKPSQSPVPINEMCIRDRYIRLLSDLSCFSINLTICLDLANKSLNFKKSSFNRRKSLVCWSSRSMFNSDCNTEVESNCREV